MNILWTSNIANNPIEKEEFIKYLYNNQRLLSRLKQIIESKEEALEHIISSLSSYEDPSWGYKQAHVNGRKAALEEIKQLITLG